MTLVCTLGLLGIASAVLIKQNNVRRWVSERLWQEYTPGEGTTFSYRSDAIRERDAALSRSDLAEAATINGHLAHEAQRRALAVHEAWLAKMDPQTKLYAQSPETPHWNYRNTAADFFCFHLIAAMDLNPDKMDTLRQTLAAEEQLRTEQGLCLPVEAHTLEPLAVDHDELIFASSEYVKDGLLSVFERHGYGEIDGRMFKIVDALIAGSKHQSRQGPIPSTDNEPNGNLLQACGRLSYAAGRDDYAEFAARIADAMILQAIPANGGLLPSDFDYERHVVLVPELKLKDHGNEAVLGLSEVYALAVARSGEAAWADRAKRWAEPLAHLFELILTHGKTSAGLLARTMQGDPPQATSEDAADNWGYILVGSMLFVEAARQHGAVDETRLAALDEQIAATAARVFARPIRPWVGPMDSDADAIESAIYVAAYRPQLRSSALQWADRQMQMMYGHQKADGTATNGYLDGNFIRTSLLYRDARSGGWRAEPFRGDVRVGYAEDGQGKAVLAVSSQQPYTGTLVQDGPRHKTIMKLPWNWPRLNSWPEWMSSVPSDIRNAAGQVRPTPAADGSLRIDIVLPSQKPSHIYLARQIR